jgi:hypothetical protein
MTPEDARDERLAEKVYAELLAEEEYQAGSMAHELVAKKAAELEHSHSPGPWRLKEGSVATIVNRRGQEVAITLYHAIGDFDEERANGRLIVAAPELLKACEAVMAAADRWEGGISLSPGERLTEQLRAAIALAKGVQP